MGRERQIVKGTEDGVWKGTDGEEKADREGDRRGRWKGGGWEGKGRYRRGHKMGLGRERMGRERQTEKGTRLEVG